MAPIKNAVVVGLEVFQILFSKRAHVLAVRPVYFSHVGLQDLVQKLRPILIDAIGNLRSALLGYVHSAHVPRLTLYHRLVHAIIVHDYLALVYITLFVCYNYLRLVRVRTSVDPPIIKI